ncbi:MAG: Gfo/Idh/MocA family oxidoreductase [Chloroflexi bacterium]|nr:Gfo/Idh/MocA family oxidoreductase [Chloroflexota bacterium]
MSNRILRWGLLSTAHINRSLIPPLRSSPRNELVAVAGRDLARTNAYAETWHIGRAYGSYEELLAAPDIDVVYISLPNSMHAEWAIKAMQAGKHVLCEKPLANTVEEVDTMIAAASEHKVVLAEAFMYRHHPQTLQVKQIINAGTIGHIRLIRGSFSFQIDAESNIRLNKSLGGGSIWDVGCYPINYARTMLGREPLTVFGSSIIGTSGVDDTFTGLMRWPNGAIAQFDSSLRMPFRTHMEIVGSEGMIVIPRPFKPDSVCEIHVGSAYDSLETIRITGPEHLYSGEVEDMADAILDEKMPRVSLQDSRQNVRVIQALLHSAAEGAVVRLA